MRNNHLALLGDFGGTNVRLALADLSQALPSVGDIRHFLSKDFKSGADPIDSYLHSLHADEQPSVAAIAVAGPVTNGVVHFTNLGWSLAATDIEALGISRAALVNDFVGMAFATRLLVEGDVRQIGRGTRDPNGNIAVMGPGTGFGAAALIYANHGPGVAVATEAGHASFAPDDETEIEVLRFLLHRFKHISIERILSGSGLCNLNEALNAVEGSGQVIDDSREITRRALAKDPICLRTVNRFCAILGSVAGNFALSYGAQGGVYVAGGIAPDILDLLDASDFRRRFEAKGRFDVYLRPIPTFVIVKPDATLLGAAAVARQLLNA